MQAGHLHAIECILCRYLRRPRTRVRHGQKCNARGEHHRGVRLGGAVGQPFPGLGSSDAPAELADREAREDQRHPDQDAPNELFVEHDRTRGQGHRRDHVIDQR
jgi:hypothetical protein